jgi:hypothetical protein
MKKIVSIILILSVFFQLMACSMAKLTVQVSMPLIEGGMIAMNQQADLELASVAIPANISLIEGMLINDPDNEVLRLYAAQAYYGYAFGFVEEGFSEAAVNLNNTGQLGNPKRAAQLYQQGYQHAQYVLHQKGISLDLFEGELKPFQQAINQLDTQAVASLFWAASCWAKQIDINRDQASELAQMPKAVMLMQRVLELDEDYYMSGAHIFFGVYYGSKSPMLGGNYQLSAHHFAQADQANQYKLLIVKVLQAQYLERQRFNQSAFHELLMTVQEASDDLYPEQRLINQIAKYKASLLLNKEELWF